VADVVYRYKEGLAEFDATRQAAARATADSDDDSVSVNVSFAIATSMVLVMATNYLTGGN
jgi:hypothetical protein